MVSAEGFLCVFLRELDALHFSKRKHSSLRSRSAALPRSCQRIKKGSVSFASGTKFDAFEDYNKLNLTILRNMNAFSDSGPVTWKSNQRELRISLTNDAGDEVDKSDNSDQAEGFPRKRESKYHSQGEDSSDKQDSDRLTLAVPHRRESFLYKSDSEFELASKCVTSRHHSFSEGTRVEELVTPFAQILSSLRNVRNNFISLTNVKKERRRGSVGSPISRKLLPVDIINGTGSGSLIQSRDENYQKMAVCTLDEIEWVLYQLETLHPHTSVSEMASNKFKRLLNRELKDFSEANNSGNQVSAWVYNTFTEKQLDVEGGGETGKARKECIRARSRSMVNGVRKLTRLHSFSGSIPRFGVEVSNEAELAKHLDDIDQWTFDPFKLDKISQGHPLIAVTYTILQARDLLKTFKIRPTTFINYMALVEKHYLKDVPFHNCIHASDVTQTTHVLLSAQAFESVFSDLEILGAILASAVHDVDHPGVNNHFLVATNSEMALMYNDESVLENHHLAVAFQLLQHEECDIFENVGKQERQAIRRMMIEMVLATDNAKHMGLLASLKTMVESKRVAGSGDLYVDSYTDRMQVLKSLVHCSDLSNPTKPLELYRQWVDRLMEEFFRQGDKEREIKGMDISPMMDRQNASVEKSQVVFIDFVAQPLWETWSDLVYPEASNILDRIEENREWYNAQVIKNDPERPPASALKEKRVSWQGTRKVAIEEPDTSDEESAQQRKIRKESEKKEAEPNNKEVLATIGSSSRSCEADDEFDEESEEDTNKQNGDN